MSSSLVTIDIALLTALLTTAVVTDFRSRRIPNKLILLGLALAVVVQAISTNTESASLAGRGWWSALLGLFTGSLLLMPLHLLRAMGAGDVKLMAMVGAFIGAPAVVTATLYTLLAGGVLSLVFMLGHGVAAQTLSNLRYMLFDWAQRAQGGQGVRLPPLQTTAARLPYALAIAVGAAMALLWPLELITGRGT